MARSEYWMARLAPMAFVGLLAACATAPKPADIQTVCLPIKSYTPAEQQNIKAALATLPQDSILRAIILDYENLRDADRACQSARPPLPPG